MQAKESLPNRLACRRRLPCRTVSDRFPFVAGKASIATGPCRKHVLLQGVVSEGTQREKKAHTG